METRGNILVAEDDYYFAETLKKHLDGAGFTVTLCSDGETALKAFKKHSYELCIFDIMMPKKDGFTLATAVRKYNERIPILFLTSKIRDEDKILGFKSGGDGYITKPYSISELLLRIEVFLKRSKPLNSDKGDVFKVGSLIFNFDELILMTCDRTQLIASLTQKAAELLKFFCNNPNKLLLREEILYNVWGTYGYYQGRSMDVFIVKLRKVLEVDRSIQIETTHGLGFAFRAEVTDMNQPK